MEKFKKIIYAIAITLLVIIVTLLYLIFTNDVTAPTPYKIQESGSAHYKFITPQYASINMH
jgi:hypothetical protein